MDWSNQSQVPLIGAVSRGFTIASATFGRPADTNAYAAGDLVANNTSAGSVTPMSLSVGRFTAANGRVKSVRLSKSTNTLTNASFKVHFYTVSPTPANGDNGAWSTDQAATYLGSVGITMDKAFTDGANGRSDCDLPFAAVANTIFALLEVTGPYAPGSAEVFVLKAEVEQD